MTQVFTPNNDAGYCTKCQRGYAIGPHVCAATTAHQLDMVPMDAAALEHAAEQLPKARAVEPRLPLLPLGKLLEQHSRFDLGHELVLPERAREDHR